MNLQRIAVSVELGGPVDPEAFVPVFHEWIQRGSVEGRLIDVARYGHVHDGPGVMLVGHDGDYSVDMLGGRPSLRYTLKRDEDGTPRALVRVSLRRLRGAIAEVRSVPGSAVDASHVDVRVYDRLRAPNTADTEAVLSAELAGGVGDEFGGTDLRFARLTDDPREPFGLRVTLVAQPSI